MSLKEFSQADGQAVEDSPPQTGETFSEHFARLRLDAIAASLTNPRRHFDEAKLLDLAESISASGVHQPILVRPLPPARENEEFTEEVRPTYEIVAGERRFRASKAAGLDTIPAMIRQLTDGQVLEIQLIENLQRDDLSELEEAEGYERLISNTNLSKDELAEKIGKSRAYIYARLKLLDLTLEGRKAMQDGKMDFSRALLVARIPDPTLQIKAIKAFTEVDGFGDAHMGIRAAQEWIKNHVMVALKDARFALKDAALVPAAGACTACPKRTGANPDLFADMRGPDACTDPHCFDTKQQAHTVRIADEARNKGIKVIEGDQAEEAVPYKGANLRGMARLDDKVPLGNGKSKTLRELLDKKTLAAKTQLLINPHDSEPIEVVPREVLDGVLRGQKSPAEKRQEKAEAVEVQKRREAEIELDAARKYHHRWRKLAIDEIATRVRNGEAQSFQPALLRAMLGEFGPLQRVDYFHMAQALGGSFEEQDDVSESEVDSAMAALPDDKLGLTLVLCLLHAEYPIRYDWVDGKRTLELGTPVIDSLAASLGMDLEAIQRSVQGEIRAEVTDAPAPSTGKKKGKQKASVSQAKADIADALQQLEQEPDEVDG